MNLPAPTLTTLPIDETLSPAECAPRLKRSKATILRAIHRGSCPSAFRTSAGDWRIPANALGAFALALNATKRGRPALTRASDSLASPMPV